MVEYIHRYFRDGVEMPREMWWQYLNEDIVAEEKSRITGDFFKSAIYSDISNGRAITLNGHEYTQRNDEECDSATELLSRMLLHSKMDSILDAVEKLPEDIAEKLVGYIEGVTMIDEKFVIFGVDE